tara:strand:- start:1482 stop:1685 length:204 start_codon:yes stop_codon:yes gene_type:complete
MLIFHVVGIEYDNFQIPIKIKILGSFLDICEALSYRDKHIKYMKVKIVQSYLNNLYENSKINNEINF